MRKTDLWWLLALPIYQLIGTARHEVSHAIVAAAQGAHITRIVVLPSFQPEGFLWGYASWTGGHVTELATAAPYICDLAVFLLFLPLCALAVHSPRWLWINCFIIGLLSPLIDTAANYSKLFRRNIGDVNELVAQFPPAAIHAVFPAAILFYSVGIWFTWRAYHRNQEPPAT